jgi:hypothetical protein
MPSDEDNDQSYSRIVDAVDWDNPHRPDHLEELRRLAAEDHSESMTLLAILLGEIDSIRYRDEIVTLNERAYKLGSPVAAENMAIQYEQWNEPFMSRLWQSRRVR